MCQRGFLHNPSCMERTAYVGGWAKTPIFSPVDAPISIKAQVQCQTCHRATLAYGDECPSGLVTLVGLN